MHLLVQFLLKLSHLGYETGVAQVTVFQLFFLSLCGRGICKRTGELQAALLLFLVSELFSENEHLWVGSIMILQDT